MRDRCRRRCTLPVELQKWREGEKGGGGGEGREERGGEKRGDIQELPSRRAPEREREKERKAHNITHT